MNSIFIYFLQTECMAIVHYDCKYHFFFQTTTRGNDSNTRANKEYSYVCVCTKGKERAHEHKGNQGVLKSQDKQQ